MLWGWPGIAEANHNGGCPSFRAFLKWERCSRGDASSTSFFVAPSPGPAYDKPMAKAKKFELESPDRILDEEDEETLAAIDEGIQDAKAGRTVPSEEVRKRLPKWITASSTRKGR